MYCKDYNSVSFPEMSLNGWRLWISSLIFQSLIEMNVGWFKVFDRLKLNHETLEPTYHKKKTILNVGISNSFSADGMRRLFLK